MNREELEAQWEEQRIAREAAKVAHRETVTSMAVPLAKKHGAKMRSGRISFPSVEAFTEFAIEWEEGKTQRDYEAAVASVRNPEKLPLPGGSYGMFSWGTDWPYRVEAYVRHHKVTRAETFRRIEAATGANISSMQLRYQKG